MSETLLPPLTAANDDLTLPRMCGRYASTTPPEAIRRLVKSTAQNIRQA